MLALTIKQPWAAAIVAGAKRIENRSWRPGSPLPLQIALHAGFRVDQDGLAFCRSMGVPVEDLPAGAIVAVATVVDIVDSSADPWWRGPLGWLLENVVAIEPIPCAGRLRLWTPSTHIQRAISCRLAAARRELRR
jgi:hypothetical protein